MRHHKTSALRAAGAVLVALLALAFFFRIQLASGFDRLLSDRLDGFIQLAIMQHWANALAGLEPWNRTAYFYPWPDTLGYNEGFFLFGVVYAAAQRLGLDPFLAETAAFILFRAIGFAGFALLARQALGQPRWVALFGAALFTIAANLYLHSAHGQLFAVGLTPLLYWLLWRGGTALLARRDGAACLWGVSAALLFGAFALSSFYIAWFTCFLLALALLAALPVLPFRQLLRWPLLVTLAALLLALVPLAITYLPKARETGMHDFAELLAYAPSPLDFIHVGGSNLLFGPLDDWLTRRFRPGMLEFSEHSIGYGPILLGLAAWGGIVAWRERRRAALPLVLALATTLGFLLVIHVGPITLWRFVYAAVPGAGALRVISRFVYVLAVPLVLLAMLGLTRLRRPWLIAPLALLLVAEEFTFQDTAALDRPAERAFLAAIPPAPAACRAFYVLGMTPGHATGTWLDESYPHNVDAMLIAERLALPTINGLATFNPPDWALTKPSTPGYARRVRAYLERHRLTAGICGLDLATRRWQEGLPALSAPPLLAMGHHPFGSAALDPVLDIGWEGAGPVGRWTIGPTATLSFTLPPDAVGHALALDLEGLPIVWNDGGTSPLTLSANGTPVAAWHPVAGRQHLRALIPASSATTIDLTLAVAAPRSPSQLGASPDARALGFFVLSLDLTPQ